MLTIQQRETLDAIKELDSVVVSIPKPKKPRGTFWTVDCETDPFHNCDNVLCPKCGGRGRVPQPFVWGAYEGKSETFEEFATAEDFAVWAGSESRTFYAHNGGKFDYHYLRDFINTDEPVLIINGRLAKFRIGKAEFRDSLNIFPNTRLKDFNEGASKKIEIDYALLEPQTRTDPNVWPKIIEYLKQDCVLLWDKVWRYWNEYGKCITQASSSMKYWSKMYDIEPPRQTRSQFEKYKTYYYGGRVECFESGVKNTNFAVADINSAYPFAMLRSHPFCVRAIHQTTLPKTQEEQDTSLIDVTCIAKGCFPWKDPDTQKTYFPWDERTRRRYWITGWEFRAAAELGAISDIRINHVHWFPKRIDFKAYIEHFFNLREEARKRGDVAGRIFGKYFMNSLYGKFGSNCANYAEYVLAFMDNLQHWEKQGYALAHDWGERKVLARGPTEDQLEDVTQTRWRYFNVATAASITGFVRAYLFKALHSCSGVIYCDTDSVAARGTEKLSFGTALGAYKHEGSFDQYAIAGKKMYAFHKAGAPFVYVPGSDEVDANWKIACKGVKIGPEEIIKIANGEMMEHRPEVPTYSATRPHPVFINRTVVNTYSNISQAPNKVHPHNKNLDPIVIRI